MTDPQLNLEKLSHLNTRELQGTVATVLGALNALVRHARADARKCRESGLFAMAIFFDDYAQAGEMVLDETGLVDGVAEAAEDAEAEEVLAAIPQLLERLESRQRYGPPLSPEVV